MKLLSIFLFLVVLVTMTLARPQEGLEKHYEADVVEVEHPEIILDHESLVENEAKIKQVYEALKKIGEDFDAGRSLDL